MMQVNGSCHGSMATILPGTSTTECLQCEIWGFHSMDGEWTSHSAFYEAAACNVEHLFTYGILPEINGKWYTRKAVANETGVVDLPKVQESPEEEDSEKLWCFCGEPSFGDMVMCDNPHCTIQWFHFDCLRLRCAPKGKWYCPSCHKLLNFNCSRRGKQKAKCVL